MSKKNIIAIFAVALLTSIVMPSYGVNLLQNPSLETWTNIQQPANWTVEETSYCKVYKESTTVFHGTFSAKLKRTIAGTGSSKGLLQQCSIPGPGRYIARVRFFENTDSVDGGLVISWRRADGSFISSWSTTKTVNSPSWQLVIRNSASDTAPAGAAKADFLIRTYGINSTTPAGGTLFVDSIFFGRSTAIEEENGARLKSILNLEVTPNPFTTTTLINFAVNPSSFIAVKIYDATGNLVKTLTSPNHINGFYKATWNGRNEKGVLSASGVYFVVLETDNAETKTVKTLFLR